MNIPLLDLTRQFKEIKTDIMNYLESVCDSQQFILGKEVEALESDICTFIGAKHSVGVTSGTDALIMGLKALGVGEGDEVITTPYSFFATASSIARVGAKPIFVDVEKNSFNIDCSKIQSAITKKTKAIMPVHLFGQCADISYILDIAKANNISVIEDCAQSIGATFQGKQSGTFGDVGCFSFFPSKNLGAFGDGGLVSTNSQDIYQTLKMDRVHGSKIKYYHEFIGGNFRLDALQAGVLRIKLRLLNSWTEGRRRNAKLYQELLNRDSKENNISSYINLPQELPERYHVYNQFCITAENRDELAKFLKESGIGVEMYYPLPLHLQKCFEYLGYKEGDFPIAEELAKTSLALPIFTELTTDEISYVFSKIKEFYVGK